MSISNVGFCYCLELTERIGALNIKRIETNFHQDSLLANSLRLRLPFSQLD